MSRRRIPTDEWCRLSVRWYADPVLRAATRQAPLAMTMFPVLLGMAKAASHGVENPDGSIVISLEDLAGDCCATKGRTSAALKALEDGDLVSVAADRVGLIRITLNGFAKWQTPRQSKAERMELAADRKRNDFAGKNTPIRDTRGTEVTLDTEEEEDTEEPPPTPAPHGGGDSGSAALLPTRPEQYAAAIQGCRRKLGDLNLAAMEAESAIREHRGIGDLEPSWLFEELYRPLALMFDEFPRDAIRAAIMSVVGKPDVTSPKAWMRAVAEREATRPTPKRKTFAEKKVDDDMAAMAASLAARTAKYNGTTGEVF